MPPRKAIRRFVLAAFGLAAFGVLGAPAPASAQLEIGGMRLEGEIEAGPRFFLVEPSKSRSSKFLEYRDINEGLFLQDLRLRIFRPDESYSTEIGGRQWGLEDQEYYLRTGRLGKWEFGFDWDQMRHILSTNARMLSTEGSRGVFTLPTPRPALSLHNSARELDEISVRWDTARAFLRLTPAEDLEITIEGTRIRKEGDRPMGMAFGSPANNFLEVLQPLDQTIYEARVRATLARERWQIQFGYTLSLFLNDERRIVADNPCFANAAACGAGDGGAAAPSRGQSSLPPDNMAHTFSLAGGVNLPMRTRLTGNFNYSLRLQDESFLPHTINPALDGNPSLNLPRKDLDGNVQVFSFNLTATSRPLPLPVVFTAKYRYYDLRDWSDQMTFPGHVVDDRTLSTDPRRAGRWSYSKQNAGLDARWKIIERLAFTTGVAWERWDRNEHREVPVSDEFFAKGVLDYTPSDWLMVRASYVPSYRRIERYNTRAHAEHAVEEDPAAAAQGQSLLLRKFDMGERNRQKAELQLQITPLETLSITPTVAYRWDDYIRSTLGLQEEKSWSTGIDLNWAPVERLSFFGGYMHESIYQKQRSRSRPVTGATTLDFADYDWISNNIDTIDTFNVGFKAIFIPGKLDWKANGSFSTATGEIKTRNPVGVASGTAAQQAAARAKRMPAFDDTLWRVDTSLRYHLSRAWTVSLNYVFESFSKHDWRTDTLNPFVPGVTSIWLGNDQKNYTAHIIGATLRYRFE
jgi:MtrB/PioB family decaheme-associated outer membrane protein